MNLSAFFLFLVIPFVFNAQQYDWEKRARIERETSLQNYIDAQNAAYRERNKKNTNITGSATNSTAILTSEEKIALAKAQEEARALSAKRYADAEERARYEEQMWRNLHAKWDRENLENKRGSVLYYMQQIRIQSLSNNDKQQAAENITLDRFTLESEFSKRYDSALSAIEEYEKSAATNDFEVSLNQLLKTIDFPQFYSAAHKQLALKFPDHRDVIEKQELEGIHVYFGSARPYVNFSLEYKYPFSSYEILDSTERVILLNRFEELASKFPDLALIVAGKCRNHLNPFHLYSTSNLTLINKTDGKRLEFLYNSLRSVRPNFTTKTTLSKDSWRSIADVMLRKSSEELKLVYPTFVSNMSGEEWLEISKANKINLEYVAWAFRTDDRDEEYFSKYPSLIEVSKIEFEPEKKEGETSLLFKNRDRYVGEVKNGVPHGFGTYYYIGGVTYIGEFENGKRNGQGKLIIKGGWYIEGLFKNSDATKKVTYHSADGKEVSKEVYQSYVKGLYN